MLPIRVEPKSESALDVADWLELQLLVGAAWRVTETNARDFLDRQGLGESFGSSVAGAIVAMRRRSRRLFERYPIIAEAGGFARRSEREACLHYIALLAACCRDLEDLGSSVAEVASLFEQYCEGVLAGLGGERGRAVHFGWPSRSGRPERFPEAIRWLAQKLGLEPGDGYRDPRRRDGGVDLVSWNALPDGRAFDIRLTQCTIGLGLLQKAREIDVGQWMRWIHFTEEPRVAIAVPYQVPVRSLEAREATYLGSLVLDRLSLVQAAEPENGLATHAATRILKCVGLSFLVDAAQ